MNKIGAGEPGVPLPEPNGKNIFSGNIEKQVASREEKPRNHPVNPARTGIIFTTKTAHFVI